MDKEKAIFILIMNTCEIKRALYVHLHRKSAGKWRIYDIAENNFTNHTLSQRKTQTVRLVSFNGVFTLSLLMTQACARRCETYNPSQINYLLYRLMRSMDTQIAIQYSCSSGLDSLHRSFEIQKFFFVHLKRKHPRHVFSKIIAVLNFVVELSL